MASAQRHSSLPSLPVARELGFPGFELDSWTGVFAPAKTPQAIVDRLRRDIAQATKAQDFRDVMEKGGGQMMNLSPAETEAFVRAEVARWVPLIRSSGISAE
jgi:tripartite-type tricarboxylate transporter receptor subunit TctC